jgi:hypothetical protein
MEFFLAIILFKILIKKINKNKNIFSLISIPKELQKIKISESLSYSDSKP